MLTEIRKSLSSDIQKTVKSIYPQLNLELADVEKLLELPKSLQQGHLAFPVFSLSKALKKAPLSISQELAEYLKNISLNYLSSVLSTGGYVNFFLKDSYLCEVLLRGLKVGTAALGHSSIGEGKTLVIDYSSPNVAKPMSIGHLRATVIGQAIRNLAETQGYKVIGINHLGDWGSQFGKLAWAIENWGHEYPLQAEPFDSLFKMYVRFHAEEEKNAELASLGAEYFRLLENGDKKIGEIWKEIRKISLDEYQRLYDLLGVRFDLVQGEAFYNPYLEPTVQKLREAGILEESQGALVVFVGEDRPPCIIKKSDGASLYATRDIASAIYRHEVLRGDEILYVVGVDQSLHFQQVFEVLKKLGLKWAEHCHHIAFGMYRFKDLGKMSTRKGSVIFMEDVIDRAIENVRVLINQKNPDLPDKDDVAKKVGVGAIIFNDLVNDRIRNVDFDWEKVLDFEGDSGPYVQYCVVRCKSLIRKFREQNGHDLELSFPTELSSDEERELFLKLLNFEDTLRAAYRQYKPNIVAGYLLEVCRAYNHFYHQHKILQSGSLELTHSRMTLVRATQMILEKGLAILGVSAPDQM